MKSKIKVFIILAVVFYFGIEFANPFKEEVVDLKKFTDYYDTTEETNGGVTLLNDSFYTFEKEYNFANEYKPIGFDKKDTGNTGTDKDRIRETAINQIMSTEKKLPVKSEYIVKQGDTISQIAEANGMTMNMLLANNPNVSVKNLKIGQKLTIVSENGIFYKVQKGDSLSKIASKFKMKLDDITAYNDIDAKNLKVGQDIFLKNPDIRVLANSGKGGITVASAGFRFPVEYKGVNSPYGSRFHPVLKRYIFHAGVDLKARYVPLRAAQSGKVSYAGYMNGYGKIIIIKHSNGYETRYAHLDKIGVKVGQNVNKGELIGKTGMSGRVTGPHLHFEVRKNGKTENPMSHLTRK
ncbi:MULTISPECIES: peptidoglycan DD-metalloendopeptidase family protein [Fusobacterium]|uniref:peptidoglycan DD-metalloendopeptidase family protein n=1 Tax=Fusobacterium TaxID=848 RepID=UPI0008A1E081|nr:MULTISPECIES: M23 family metallopeptidase [Fusobacterium]MCF0171298.1 M23 family metallopeptidase [Fusobacterium varium]OFL83655.1 peptidase M23 [Fusobacterium sp. HMSC073F01]